MYTTNKLKNVGVNSVEEQIKLKSSLQETFHSVGNGSNIDGN